MNRLIKWALILGGIFGGCVLLTPVLHRLLPMFLFEKIFNRIIMLSFVGAAAVSIWKGKISWKFYGLDFELPWKRLFGWGFTAGFLMVFVITLIELWWGPRYIRENMGISDIIQRLIKAMLSGTAVGIVEEFFFRGFIFSSLEQKIKTWPALIGTSAVYSLVHFLDNGQIFIPKNPGLRDSARLLVGYLEPFYGSFQKIAPEFIGLFLFGIVLNIVFMRTRSVFSAAGVHAGAVFCIKFQNAFVRKGPEIYHPAYGNTPHYDGPAEWAVLVLFALFLYRFCRASSKETA